MDAALKPGRPRLRGRRSRSFPRKKEHGRSKQPPWQQVISCGGMRMQQSWGRGHSPCKTMAEVTAECQDNFVVRSHAHSEHAVKPEEFRNDDSCDNQPNSDSAGTSIVVSLHAQCQPHCEKKRHHDADSFSSRITILGDRATCPRAPRDCKGDSCRADRLTRVARRADRTRPSSVAPSSSASSLGSNTQSLWPPLFCPCMPS